MDATESEPEIVLGRGGMPGDSGPAEPLTMWGVPLMVVEDEDFGRTFPNGLIADVKP